MKNGLLREVCQTCYMSGDSGDQELVKEYEDKHYVHYRCPTCGDVRVFPKKLLRIRINNALRLPMPEMQETL